MLVAVCVVARDVRLSWRKIKPLLSAAPPPPSIARSLHHPTVIPFTRTNSSATNPLACQERPRGVYTIMKQYSDVSTINKLYHLQQFGTQLETKNDIRSQLPTFRVVISVQFWEIGL